MRFELEYPYSEDWDWAYLQVNRENRKTVYLYRSPEKGKKRSTTSYARYFMTVLKKRYLGEDEHVDHIDDDKTNDNFWNLQILTPQENKIKEETRQRKAGTLRKRMVLTKCPCCSCKIEKPFNQSAYSGYHTKKNDFCSRSCSGKFYNKGKQPQEYEEFFI